MAVNCSGRRLKTTVQTSENLGSLKSHRIVNLKHARNASFLPVIRAQSSPGSYSHFLYQFFWHTNSWVFKVLSDCLSGNLRFFLLGPVPLGCFFSSCRFLLSLHFFSPIPISSLLITVGKRLWAEVAVQERRKHEAELGSAEIMVEVVRPRGL